MKTYMQQRRTNWDFLAIQLLNNTCWYRKEYVDQKLYRLKAQLMRLLAMTDADIENSPAMRFPNRGVLNITSREELYLNIAGHKYVIALLETYDYHYVNNAYLEHCHKCNVEYGDHMHFGRKHDRNIFQLPCW